MPPLFSSTNPPASLDAIQAFELKENISLPDDYKLFLQTHNGGFTKATFVEYVQHGRARISYIDQFYGLSEGNELFPSLEDARENMKRNYLPLDLLCIAGTENGDPEFVLKVQGQGEIGKVFVWFTSEPEFKYVVPLADSFTEFFEMTLHHK
jgi:hypothetical protein